ncbi:anti-sigma factor [Pseudomonas sp. UL073]|uniref:Anti-sigma factor n=1 Tax=Zestomonas insulae TaxID=2809017 RepID=A0ABS2IBR3_9GAMM|nr:RseA family anti-sigma factor [Pseudomonas insulae]MBM7060407.1 anti-sigma factor [Pseudomonas insulae]
MSREALHESLSAVMDNEADELELRRVLSTVDDSELRDKWSRFQIARAVMHKELLEPRLDIAASVSAALANEAPHQVAATPQQASHRMRLFSRVAIAASVTLAVLAGVRFYNQSDVAGPQLAQQVPSSVTTPAVQGSAVLAGYSSEGMESAPAPSMSAPVQGGPTWQEQRLPSYLRQHAQQAAMSGNAAEGALPYARAASLEGR